MTRPDDDALSWDGDDDPTLDPVSAGTAGERRLPAGYTAVGRGSDDLAAREDSSTGPRDAEGDETSPESSANQRSAGVGNASLVALGVLGGVYLLYAVGWLVGGLRLQAVAGLLVSSAGASAPPTWSAGNAVALVLAVAAPPIWFAVTLLLTRGGRPWVRWLVLAAGVVLLVPWPFVMVGAIGS